MKDTATKAQFVELRGRGLSFDKISQELKVSKVTLIQWSKELALEIKNQKAMEIDNLLGTYMLTKKHRLEVYGGQLKTLREELKKRSLSDLPTDRLFDLCLKYGQFLKQEDTLLSFAQKVTLDEQIKNLNLSTSTWNV